MVDRSNAAAGAD